MDELQRLENLQRQLGNDALTGGAIGAAIGALVEGARYMKVVRETDDARRKELDERIEKLEKLASSASQVVMIPQSPHKNPSTPPTLETKSAAITNNIGSIEFAAGSTPTDQACRIAINTGRQNTEQNSSLFRLSFATAYQQVPVVNVQTVGGAGAAVRVQSVTKQSIDVVASTEIAPNQNLELHVLVVPTAASEILS